MRNWIRRVFWILQTQVGFDPRVMFRSLLGVRRYIRDWGRFREGYCYTMLFRPCLQDWHEEGGATQNEYFWQDLLVARKVFAARPQLHVDVGSRVDGFVSHVASFRDIEILDVRPITSAIPGVTFRQADLMQPVVAMSAYCDSLSCLHALEHFGLGRYGDPINTRGYARGIENLAKLLREGGRLYLSVPIGRQRVEFNAGWIFDPRTIISEAEQHGLTVEELTVVVSGGIREKLLPTQQDLVRLGGDNYAIGIFEFKKLPETSLPRVTCPCS